MFVLGVITGIIVMCLIGWVAYEIIIRNNNGDNFTGI